MGVGNPDSKCQIFIKIYVKYIHKFKLKVTLTLCQLSKGIKPRMKKRDCENHFGVKTHYRNFSRF